MTNPFSIPSVFHVNVYIYRDLWSREDDKIIFCTFCKIVSYKITIPKIKLAKLKNLILSTDPSPRKKIIKRKRKESVKGKKHYKFFFDGT